MAFITAQLHLRGKAKLPLSLRLQGRIILSGGGRVEFGNGVSLVGTVVPIEIVAHKGARISIGDDTFINYGSSISAHKHIEIGHHCLLGHYTLLLDSNEHGVEQRDLAKSSAPIIIGDHVWIGSRVIILPGVSIGDHAAVGAGSVVTRNIPANCLAVGNPAHVVRKLTILAPEPVGDTGPQIIGHVTPVVRDRSVPRSSLVRRMRLRQVRFCSRWICRLSNIRFGRSLVRWAHRAPIASQMMQFAIGFRGPFATLADAAAAIRGIEGSGHSNPAYRDVHLALADEMRPSDYPALFHLRSVLPKVRKVFDIGGSIGNVFYCYARYLDFPADLTWTVHDLPQTLRMGEELARLRDERRLRFSEQLAEAEGADLLLASGSLHYFDRPLPELIAGFVSRPRYILINRTPLTDGTTCATVQDGGEWLLACMLYNRDQLVQGLEALDYEITDSWQAPELSVIIPGSPEQSAPGYSGLFFRQRAPSVVARHDRKMPGFAGESECSQGVRASWFIASTLGEAIF